METRERATSDSLGQGRTKLSLLEGLMLEIVIHASDLLSTYCITIAILDTESTAVNNMDKVLAYIELTS